MSEAEDKKNNNEDNQSEVKTKDQEVEKTSKKIDFTDPKVKTGIVVVSVLVIFVAFKIIRSHMQARSVPQQQMYAFQGNMPKLPVPMNMQNKYPAGMPNHSGMPPGGGFIAQNPLANMQKMPNIQNMQNMQYQQQQPLIKTNNSDNISRKVVAPSVVNHVTALLQTLSGGHVSVKSVYPGPDGLVGVYWVTESGVKRIGWASPGGNLLLVGAAFAIDGKDWTAMANAKIQGKKYEAGSLPKIDPRSGMVSPTAAKELYLKASNLKYFTSGHGKKFIYVFADPDCIYCHKFWVNIGKNQHDVTIRWILTGGIHQTSAAKAATILASKNPLKLWTLNEARYSSSDEEGGVRPLEGPDKTQVMRNDKALVGTLQMGGTPTFVWMDSDGVPHAKMGLESLKEWKKIVESMQ